MRSLSSWMSFGWRIALVAAAVGMAGAWHAMSLPAAAAGANGGAPLLRTIVWSARIPGVGAATPYPSAEAADSVVVFSEAGHIIRLDAKGQPVFDYDMGDDIESLAASGDIDGDGKAEIVACTVRGHVVALTGQGKPKWIHEVRNLFRGIVNVVLAQRPGSAVGDVLLGSSDGWLTCLDGKGNHRWSFRVARDGRISPPAVGDLDGDGIPEYVCGVDADRVIALTNDGHLLWEYVTPAEFGREVPVIADADRNGTPEIYILNAAAVSDLFCVNGPTGELLWRVPINAKCYRSQVVTDINGDGYDEILVGSKYTRITAFSRTGDRLWEQTMSGFGIFWNPAAADVDGDGRLEIVTGGRYTGPEGTSLYVLDAQGNVRGAYPQEGDANSAVVIADLDRDGLLEVVNCSASTVFAYHFGSPPRAGKVQWPCYRANAAMTGCQLPLGPARAAARQPGPAPSGAILPRRFQAILGATKLTASWTAPTPAQGCVEVTMVTPGGKQLTQVFPTQADKQSVELELPFGHGGQYALTARLVDTGRRQAVLQDRLELSYEPLSAERQMVGVALAAASKAVSDVGQAAPQASAELQRRGAVLTAALAALGERVARVPADADMPQELLDGATALRAQAQRDERFASFAGRTAAKTPGLLFAAWQDADPWDNADPRDDLPQAAADKVEFAAWTYGNQREDFCINLLPLGPEPFDVRVEPADLVGPGGAKARWEKHLTLLDPIWLPSTLNPGPVPDMLPRMNAGRTTRLAPGSFAQVWLVVDTKDLAPGQWTIPLHLQSLTMSAAAADVNLNLEVLPVALPYPYPWKLCNWVSPDRYPQPLRDRVIENLISHGSNVLYAPMPSRACDAEGRLVGAPDWTALDELVAKAKPGGPFLYLHMPRVSAPAGMSEDSPAYKQAYKQWMRELVTHLAAIGITYRDFAFYPVDEPGNSGHSSIEQLIAAAKVLREADPQAPIYADPAGAAYPVEWMRELDPWVDVWQPAMSVAARKDLIEIMNTRNRRLWTYDAMAGARGLGALGFYRRQAWFALRIGARGSGYWVYSAGASQNGDLWGVGPTREPNYSAVDIDRTEVIDSRHWRATHDGVQDVTAVLLLDDAIAEAERAGVQAALCEKAKAARAAAVSEVTGGTEPTGNLRFEVLQAQRRRVADSLVELRAAIAAKQG